MKNTQEDAMTKAEAVKQLISDFTNKMIADDWQYVDALDSAMCKALKIKNPKGE